MAAWNNGGKEKSLDRMQIEMPHDELLSEIGEEISQKIERAGFVLVPRRWREDVFKALDELARLRKKTKELKS